MTRVMWGLGKDSERPNVSHVVPREERVHMEGFECVCRPKLEAVCTECHADAVTCWKCARQPMYLTRAEAEATPYDVIVLHNAVGEDPDA